MVCSVAVFLSSATDAILSPRPVIVNVFSLFYLFQTIHTIMPDPSIFILYSVSIRILLYTGFQNRPVQYFLAEIYIERSSPAAHTTLTTVASTPSLSVPTIISISTNSSTGNVTKMTASQYLIHFIMCGQFVLFMLIPGILRELHFDKFTLWKLHFCNHPV